MYFSISHYLKSAIASFGIHTCNCQNVDCDIFAESTKEDDNNRVKIPDLVTIELAPYTNSAWAQVQEMAQNPRIRLKLKPDRKLSNVIEFLNKKWKPNRVRMKESLEEKEQPQQEIKLHLADKVKVFPVDLEIAPPQPRLDLGFINYKEYIRSES